MQVTCPLSLLFAIHSSHDAFYRCSLVAGLIDRYLGIRWGAAFFCGLVMIGRIVFAFSTNIKSYATSFVGRLIFGLDPLLLLVMLTDTRCSLGGESLSVLQTISQVVQGQRTGDGVWQPLFILPASAVQSTSDMCVSYRTSWRSDRCIPFTPCIFSRCNRSLAIVIFYLVVLLRIGGESPRSEPSIAKAYDVPPPCRSAQCRTVSRCSLHMS